jgi:hypothetical protein
MYFSKTMSCLRNGRRWAHSHDSVAEVFARFYLAVRRSSVQPSLLRLLTKVQAGAHIEFFPKREVSNPAFPFFLNKSRAPISQVNSQAARRVAGDGGFASSLFTRYLPSISLAPPQV